MVSLNGKYDTYMHLNIEKELNIAFLEVLHPFFLFYILAKEGLQEQASIAAMVVAVLCYFYLLGLTRQLPQV